MTEFEKDRDMYTVEYLSDCGLSRCDTEFHRSGELAFKSGFQKGFDYRQDEVDVLKDEKVYLLNTENEKLQAKVQELEAELDASKFYCPVCNSCGEAECCAVEKCLYPGVKAEELKYRDNKITSLVRLVNEMRTAIQRRMNSDDACEKERLEEFGGVTEIEIQAQKIASLEIEYQRLESKLAKAIEQRDDMTREAIEYISADAIERMNQELEKE